MSDDPQIEFEAWEPQVPKEDFAERVLGRIRDEASIASKSAAAPDAHTHAQGRRKARRWGAVAGGAGVLALAAAMALRVTSSPASRGEAIAKERTEVSIGSRARAVLEPGAEVKWDGDDVVQAHGDVFYRVEPGARFRVHTAAGDVEVKGTCFAVKVRGEGSSNSEGGIMDRRDVKSGAIGAALSALAFVAVYEGKVAVSHAGQSVDLKAGETAQSGADGVQASGSLGAGEKKFDDKAAAAGEEPLSKANETLVSQVGEYRRRLEAITAQKIELEQTLKNTEQKLASASADGSAPRGRAEFDLGTDEWKELAKDGTVKFMSPCTRLSRVGTPEMLQKLALAPQDGAVLKNAYKTSNDRLWATLRPLCAQAGGSLEIADKIGPDTCMHLIADEAKKSDQNAANEGMRQVGEIRAGLRPMPSGDIGNPVTKMFLALTGELKLFESDLAKAFGPEEAHRITYGEGMCMHSSTFGGPGPREPEKK